MRCTRAQQWMTAALDRELDPRRRRAFDRHVASCGPCAREMARTARLLEHVGTFPAEAPVPARLEQDTLRRVRLLAAAEAERPARRWWPALPAVAVAGLATIALAIGLTRQSEGPRPAPASAPQRVARAPVPPVPGRVERPTPPAPRGRAPRPDQPVASPPPEPPPELAAAPDLFMELPILRNLEKLQHYEDIRTTTLDGQTAPGGGEHTNG
jgi:hypothetical protein